MNHATLFPMEVGDGVSLRGVMQIKYFKDKIFPLVGENKCLHPPFTFFVESPVRSNIAFRCLSYRS